MRKPSNLTTIAVENGGGVVAVVAINENIQNTQLLQLTVMTRTKYNVLEILAFKHTFLLFRPVFVITSWVSILHKSEVTL